MLSRYTGGKPIELRISFLVKRPCEWRIPSANSRQRTAIFSGKTLCFLSLFTTSLFSRTRLEIVGLIDQTHDCFRFGRGKWKRSGSVLFSPSVVLFFSVFFFFFFNFDTGEIINNFHRDFLSLSVKNRRKPRAICLSTISIQFINLISNLLKSRF